MALNWKTSVVLKLAFLLSKVNLNLKRGIACEKLFSMQNTSRTNEYLYPKFLTVVEGQKQFGGERKFARILLIFICPNMTDFQAAGPLPMSNFTKKIGSLCS